MKLSPTMTRFVLHWGEMGTKWGINRTVAQIFALLYLAERPLDAEEIAETLSVARSNVSTSLRELEGWGLLKSVSVLGERKEHFEISKDVWHLCKTILAERKKREIEPTLSVLRACVLEAGEDAGASVEVESRMVTLLEFLEKVTGWYEQLSRIDPSRLERLMTLGSGVLRFLEDAPKADDGA